VLERIVDAPRATSYLIATGRNVAIDRNKEAGRISLEGLDAAASVAAPVITSRAPHFG
jgi:hypothetical protein